MTPQELISLVTKVQKANKAGKQLRRSDIGNVVKIVALLGVADYKVGQCLDNWGRVQVKKTALQK